MGFTHILLSQSISCCISLIRFSVLSVLAVSQVKLQYIAFIKSSVLCCFLFPFLFLFSLSLNISFDFALECVIINYISTFGEWYIGMSRIVMTLKGLSKDLGVSLVARGSVFVVLPQLLSFKL